MKTLLCGTEPSDKDRLRSPRPSLTASTHPGGEAPHSRIHTRPLDVKKIMLHTQVTPKHCISSSRTEIPKEAAAQMEGSTVSESFNKEASI